MIPVQNLLDEMAAPAAYPLGPGAEARFDGPFETNGVLEWTFVFKVPFYGGHPIRIDKEALRGESPEKIIAVIEETVRQAVAASKDLVDRARQAWDDLSEEGS